MKIYLSGAINGRGDKANEWRQELEEQFDILNWTALNPLRRNYRGLEMAKMREIVDLDKLDIQKCDVVLLLYDSPSVGTSMEQYYAHQELGKVVVVVDVRESPRAPVSPWLVFHSTVVVYSMVEAIHWIRKRVDQHRL